jgi:hypothetical protein
VTTLAANSGHVVRIERVTRDLRSEASIPRGVTLAVVERYDGWLVKVCHGTNRRGKNPERAARVAAQFASAYGARLLTPGGVA